MGNLKVQQKWMHGWNVAATADMGLSTRISNQYKCTCAKRTFRPYFTGQNKCTDHILFEHCVVLCKSEMLVLHSEYTKPKCGTCCKRHMNLASPHNTLSVSSYRHCCFCLCWVFSEYIYYYMEIYFKATTVLTIEQTLTNDLTSGQELSKYMSSLPLIWCGFERSESACAETGSAAPQHAESPASSFRIISVSRPWIATNSERCHIDNNRLWMRPHWKLNSFGSTLLY